MRTIAIGLLGAGNVGAGVVRILRDNQDEIAKRVGARIRIKHVLVRDPARARDVEIPAGLVTTDPLRVLGDPDVRVVVELIGGVEPARSFVLRALEAGKHVVSANKALVATHGDELFGVAERRGASLLFEGAVAGGVPVLRALREGLASDRIHAIEGIVNGTSNYILDAMTRTGARYEDALAEAQKAGYAEADPTLDVEGIDAAHKLALLTLVGLGVRVDPTAISTEGITRVRPFDIKAAADLGYVIKSIAVARRTDQGPLLRVHPALIPEWNILAGVRGAYNAVLVHSEALGRSLYYGRGAGMMPTGMAVVSDIIEVCQRVIAFAGSGPRPDAYAGLTPTEPRPLDDELHENYVCVHVPNVPGILGKVASCLGTHGVSIKRVRQDPHGTGKPVDMVILTETCEERQIRSALETVDSFPEILAPTHRLRVLQPEPID